LFPANASAFLSCIHVGSSLPVSADGHRPSVFNDEEVVTEMPISEIGRRKNVLHYAIVFLILALVAAFFGFAGIAGAAAGIAKILFFVFLVVFVVSLIMGRRTVV
jgi:uncharacterized membrane protein YtjA (UPF0391 family)